ncbi:MAG TPA: S8 family serine peptidase [Candidatus Nanoarchaeia archaeon]|nr:S8 family serine peptidase [Candidatus Nanoarchaeia archaeon]
MNKSARHIGVFIAVLFLVLSIVIISAKSDNSEKIEPNVIKEAAKEGKARVIVKLKEPDMTNLKSNRQITLAREEIRKGVSDKIDKEKISHEFSSANGFSASLTSSDIEKLSQDPNVEKIYYDVPVHATLQDSVPLINATKTWSLQSGGVNLTGKGETICIIDTGVDYTHPNLGNCTPTRYEINGTNESYILESAHNYTNNYENIWNITKPGYSKIAVHFVNISVESVSEHFDYVYILNGNGSIVGFYSGTLTDFWSPSVEGDTIYIRLKSDVSITDYGFYIDQTINGTTNRTYDWSNCSKVIGGWDAVNSDPDPKDDHGHGTHVTGIAAANGTIIGTAPEAKIISIKALDSSGNGFTGDIVAGIEWCVNRSSDFNISVISMSLGSSAPYLHNSYCDAADPLTAAAINAAVAKNISVVIAAGNDGNITAISQPGCVENATPIGSIRKDDSTIDYNRNSLVQIIAPGYLINSTQNGGEYTLLSGTSMATPHAAGAFALISQYLKLNNKTRTPQQIESSLNSTGKVVYDSGSGLNYSRIDIYEAILSLDFSSPNVTLVSPNDSYSTTSSSSISFEYNVTDNSSISKCGLIVNGAISDYNSSAISTNTTNSISKTLSTGNYNWSINCTDIFGNTGNSSSRNLIVTAASSSGGGGGGGGSQKIQIYTIEESKLSGGYNITLNKGDMIKFKKNNENHTITVNSVGANFVDLTVESDPLRLILGIGESKKINLSSGDYYDLLIRLASIIGGKASITIESINELIEKPNLTLSNNQTALADTNKSKGQTYAIQDIENTSEQDKQVNSEKMRVFAITAIIAVLIFLVSYFYSQYKKSFRHLLLKKHILG